MTFRFVVYSFLFLAPVVLLPLFAHRLIVGEREFGRETGRAYLRTTAENWSARLRRGESLPTEPVGSALPVVLAEVDATGRNLATGRLFPPDGRCFGEARADDRRVRATWPGEEGRGQARARRLNRIEGLAFAGAFAFLTLGVFALLREIRRARQAARRQVEYVADVSHRLKTPLTAITLCAELAKAGRLDERRKAESQQTIVAEASKLSGILDEVLAHVREMRRG